MTPILVIGFGVQPLAAVSSDLVAAVVMKPIGGGIHLRRGTVHRGLVTWLTAGSVPSAFLGSWLISRGGEDAADRVSIALGVALLVAAVALVAKAVFGARQRSRPSGPVASIAVRPAATLAIGIVGGLVVGLTSVGSGSLMMVLLLVLYPSLTSKSLVGTDLVQAVPLVLAAALGHLLFGDVHFALTGSLLVGCVPGVIAGAQLSSRVSDAVIRPALVTVLSLSALKLLHVPNEVLLGSTVAAAVVLAGFGLRVWTGRRRAVAESARAAARAHATEAAPVAVPVARW
jgi:uncharacterized membrane protein YfcA